MPAEDRMRSLSQINGIFRAATTVGNAIAEMLETRSALDVLEVGFGYGRALMELAVCFRGRNVTFHGVDVARHIEGREALLDVARELDVIPENELLNIEWPHLHFYDATRLHFADESLDFVFSAVTIRFMQHKATFLEEVCRVLRPGGRAMLHFGESHWNYPYSVAADNRILTPYTSRFVLRHGNELIPLPVYLKLFEAGCFRFDFTTESRCIALVSKRAAGGLQLQLDYNEELSMRGKKLPLLSRKGEVRGGFRSVYDIRPEYYRALFAQGLLAREDLRTDIGLPSSQAV